MTTYLNYSSNKIRYSSGINISKMFQKRTVKLITKNLDTESVLKLPRLNYTAKVPNTLL